VGEAGRGEVQGEVVGRGRVRGAWVKGGGVAVREAELLGTCVQLCEQAAMG
jgi:hypothetical protein